MVFKFHMQNNYGAGIQNAEIQPGREKMAAVAKISKPRKSTFLQKLRVYSADFFCMEHTCDFDFQNYQNEQSLLQNKVPVTYLFLMNPILPKCQISHEKLNRIYSYSIRFICK